MMVLWRWLTNRHLTMIDRVLMWAAVLPIVYALLTGRAIAWSMFPEERSS